MAQSRRSRFMQSFPSVLVRELARQSIFITRNSWHISVVTAPQMIADIALTRNKRVAPAFLAPLQLLDFALIIGVPEGIRTPGLRFRKFSVTFGYTLA